MASLGPAPDQPAETHRSCLEPGHPGKRSHSSESGCGSSGFGIDLLLLHILAVSLSLFYPIPFNPPNALLQQFSPFSLSSIVFPSLVNYPFSIHFVKSPLK